MPLTMRAAGRTATTFKTRMSEQAAQAVQERFVGIETEYDF
jgi:hypothetical protein